MADKTTPLTARAKRKVANREKNEAQHAANLAFLQEKGISTRIRTVEKVRTDRKGNATTYKKSFEVRPSKLARTARRAA